MHCLRLSHFLVAILVVAVSFRYSNGLTRTLPTQWRGSTKQVSPYANQRRHNSGVIASAGSRRDLVARKLFLFPQIVFAASCAGAVFAYVFLNIDEIKAKQKASIDAAMIVQSDNVKSAQETQRLAIEKIKRDQEANVKRIQDEARERAEKLKR